MKSPFAFFRRHQATAMVITLVLVMFVFTVGDSLMQISGKLPTILIYLTCMFVGGSILWAMGLRREKAKEYTSVGVLVGFAFALLMTNVVLRSNKDVEISTSIGSFSEQEVTYLLRQRQLANQFVETVYARINEPPQLLDPSQLGEFALNNPQIRQQIEMSNRQRMQQYRAGVDPYLFNFGLPPRQDAVFAELMQEEADKLDIVLSDEAITKFIKELSQEKLGRKEFYEILGQMKIGETELYETLKKQRRAQLAAELLMPEALTTPSDYWELFKQANVSKNADVVAIPVKEFFSKVGKPTDEELNQLFQQAKDRFPGFDGSPGFRQPRKVSLEYLEADYKTIQESLPKITQAQIEAYYEKNKADFPYDPFPEDNTPPEDPKPREPVKAPVPNLGENTGEENSPETNNGEANNSEEKPDANSENTTPEANNSEEKPDANSENTTPEANNSEEKPETPDNTPEENSTESTEKPEGNSLKETPATTFPVAFQEGNSTEEESGESAESTETKSEDAKPETEATTPEDAKPETEATTPEDAKPETPKTEETNPEQTTPETKPEDNKPEENTEENPTAPPAPETNPLAPPEPLETEPAPPVQQYRPLDDNLRLQIEETLLEELTRKKINELMTRAYEQLGEATIDYSAAEDDAQRAAARKKVTQEMKSLAEKHGLRYAAIERVTAESLSNPEEHALGSATEVRDGETDPGFVGDRVVRTAFESEGTLYVGFRAEDSQESNNQFVWWKTADIPPEVPKFTDKGIKEQVEEAWKTLKAADLAKARAEELAKLAENSDKRLIEVFGQKTVTGEKEGLKLTSRETGSFSRLREPVTDSRNLQPNRRLEPTELIAVPNAGDEFMNTVFNDLNVDDVGVTHDRDKSHYYVVKVLSRSPGSEIGEELMKKRFLTDFAKPGSLYTPIIQQQRLMVGQSFFRKMMERYQFEVMQNNSQQQ